MLGNIPEDGDLSKIDIPNLRIIEYDINEKSGSSFDYWISMGKPKRLKKEEKEILHKSSFPKINFRYSKKSTVLNIQATLKGYSAKLIILKET